jgi:redox-sensitive bicupin YhaK (pirin superfamily)
VPGFPQHPHRGFETITYVRNGLIDHSDSLGATARFGTGDTQWLTAGGGIVHAEMFPMVHTDRGNPLELFQIWLNLPASQKLVEPYFTMRWAEQLTMVSLPGAEVAVVVGAFGDHRGAPAPPNSWAADDSHDVGVWHVSIPVGGSITLPPAQHDGVARVLYFFEGDSLTVDGTALGPSTGAVVDCSREVLVEAASAAELLVLQGQPIGEPVARYGPFVMNTEDQIREAFRDYQRTGFGGWPWPADGPAHDAGAPRFAVHPDGRREQPLSAGAAPTGG